MSLVSRPRLDFNPFPLPPPPKTQALACPTFTPPPLDGSLTVPEWYDWHYHNTPDHPVFVFPGIDGITRVVKWPEATRAIHTGARLLHGATGLKPSQGNDIVAIFAASDTVTYFTLIASVVRAGFVPFLVSPRNSSTAIAHLLSITHTNHVLVGSETALQDVFHSALRLMEQKDPGVELPSYSTAPSFEDLFITDNSFKLLPPHRPESSQLAMILHSSGSTAFPKPIGWSHLQFIQLGFVPYFGERDLTGVRLSCHAMPMYHGMGMMQTVWTASMGITITAARPQSPAIPPTPDNVLTSAKATDSDVIFCVPTFIEAWSHDPGSVEYLTTIDGVLFGGGPLNKKIGDMMVQKGVTIFTLYGCSEIGIISPILPRHTDLDWEYFSLTKQMKGVFVPNGHGQYELVLLPNPYEIPCVINGQVDGKDAYYTKDLFVPHPTKSGYYKIFGRADDQLMHSTGEKTNPGPLENILNQDPRVQAAVMFGRGQFNIGVIIDPRPAYRFDPSDAEKLAEFRNAIWPTVEHMNEYAPQHSRLFKEMILIASPNKPFDYTSKSTARRQTIIANYEYEMESLYRSVAETTQAEIQSPRVWNKNSSLAFVREIVQRVMRMDALGDSEDLFQHGCDSLQATWIRNTLLHAIRDGTRISTNDVPENMVYQYPTIAKLASFTVGLAARGIIAATSSEDHQLVAQSMVDMAERYSMTFPTKTVPIKTFADSDGDVFLVTGTTGSLGASLLCELLQSQSVRKVYAINRTGRHILPLAKRQESAFRNLGLPIELLSQPERLVLVEADTAETNAGLTSVLLEEIRSSVTHIILNAWPVDFNLSLQSFEPSIKTVRNMIDVALSSYRTNLPTLTFVSSIGVLSRHKGNSSATEAPVTCDEAQGTGYSQSKWVAESVLLKAALSTPLRPIIVRIGQLSGANNGYWKKSDWLPMMIKSSLVVKCFPSFSNDKVISWVPLDDAARVLLELAHHTHNSNNGQIFHLVHPKPVPSPVISQTFAQKLNISLVPYTDWLAHIEEKAEAISDNTKPVDELAAIPALRMPHFFRGVKERLRLEDSFSEEAWGLPTLDISQSRRSSVLMAQGDIRQIDKAEVDRWLQNWSDSGFL